MFGGRARDDLMREFIAAHQNPTNKAFHLIGIPTVVVSAVTVGMSAFLWLLSNAWPQVGFVALVTLPLGFACQFIGHAIEGNRPEVFRDWRFIFIGLQWWGLLIRGRV
jgi:uncharacterized membrane protein YGL010W